MPPEGTAAARGNCGFLDVSTILSKDSQVLTVNGNLRGLPPRHYHARIVKHYDPS